jgi:hypothetical protein
MNARRKCEASDCSNTVKKPAAGRRRFCSDRCRKRTAREGNGRYVDSSQNCPESLKSVNVFSELQTPPKWFYWEDHESDRWLDEHYLFIRDRKRLRDRHVAIIVGKPGDYRVVDPVTIPVQTATPLEAARKLALNVALWVLPARKATKEQHDAPVDGRWRDGERVRVFLEMEAPQIGCGWRYVTVRTEGKHVHLCDYYGRTAKFKLAEYEKLNAEPA